MDLLGRDIHNIDVHGCPYLIAMVNEVMNLILNINNTIHITFKHVFERIWRHPTTLTIVCCNDLHFLTTLHYSYYYNRTCF